MDPAPSVDERHSPADDALWRIAAIVTATCTVLVTLTVVWRGWMGTSEPVAVVSTDVSEASWASLSSGGRARGPLRAAVTIVEFGDFECPYCRRFTHDVLDSLRERHPNDVRLVYRHLPLSRIHRFAYPAARAAECAAVQGKFFDFHDILFSKADSLGRKSFDSFAREAGVTDLDEFNRCNHQDAEVPIVERDLALARELGVTGTPTVFVNRRRYASPPELGVLDSLVRSLREVVQ